MQASKTWSHHQGVKELLKWGSRFWFHSQLQQPQTFHRRLSWQVLLWAGLCGWAERMEPSLQWLRGCLLQCGQRAKQSAAPCQHLAVVYLWMHTSHRCLAVSPLGLACKTWNCLRFCSAQTAVSRRSCGCFKISKIIRTSSWVGEDVENVSTKYLTGTLEAFMKTDALRFCLTSLG